MRAVDAVILIQRAWRRLNECPECGTLVRVRTILKKGSCWECYLRNKYA